MLINNFKVEKSENLDNAFYVFLTLTLQKRKKSRFWIFKKRKKRILELYSQLVRNPGFQQVSN